MLSFALTYINLSKAEHLLFIDIYSSVICLFKNHFFLLGLFQWGDSIVSGSTEGFLIPTAWGQSLTSLLFSYMTLSKP